MNKNVLSYRTVLCTFFPLILFFFNGCTLNNNTIAMKGSKVKIEFTTALDNGIEYDRSDPDVPLEFVIGSGSIFPALENAVIGMRVNDTKKVVLESKDAYGLRDESKVGELPKTAFPANFEYEAGRVVKIKDNKDANNIMKGVIVEVKDGSVVIDLNHPLAGERLHFRIKLLEIIK